MAKAKNWAVVDLAQDGPTCWLEIGGADGVTLEVIQCTISFALNEIPKATCMVALGRNARTQERAKIHELGNTLSQMKEARLFLKPSGDWNPWSGERLEGTQCIFEGYYVGLAYRKVSGKIQAVLSLLHWLCDLGWTSALSVNQHPANPTSFVGTAIMEHTTREKQDKPVYVAHDVGMLDLMDMVPEDLWHGFKSFLCGLSMDDRFYIECLDDVCASGPGDKRANNMAQKALQRIEGPSADCNMEYKWGQALPLNTDGVPLLPVAVASAIVQQTLEPYASTTFWDAIVGQFCPMFQTSVVPMVNRALIIADTPSYNGPEWKILQPDDYESLDLSGMINRPLQAVGVYGDMESTTGLYDTTEPEYGDKVCIGGAYVVDEENPGDGMWMVVPSPAWLRNTQHCGTYSSCSSGVGQKLPTLSPTTEEPSCDPEEPTPGQIKEGGLCGRYKAFARSIYVEQMLRGRGAAICGKLRFDIAPGSNVRIDPKPELFEEGQDELAVTLYAHVVRVTININSEAAQCSTEFQMSHVRTEKENCDPRTSVDTHPLFDGAHHVGAPLLDDAWNFNS